MKTLLPIIIISLHAYITFIAQTCACQMYVTIMYVRLKRTLCFNASMIVLISVQDNGTVNVLQRMTYLIKEDL